MKLITALMLCTFMLTLVGCIDGHLLTEETPHPASPAPVLATETPQHPSYLSRNEVLLELNAPQPLVEPELDRGAKEREANLIPDHELLPPGEVEELEKTVP